MNKWDNSLCSTKSVKYWSYEHAISNTTDWCVSKSVHLNIDDMLTSGFRDLFSIQLL